MIATANVGAVLTDLKTRLSGIATALISRSGQVLYADLPGGAYSETFAIMCATILGAAATAHSELSRAPPERIVVEGPDSTLIIVGSGPMALLVALVDHRSDLANAVNEVAKFADLLRTETR
jgi:uncharacterized protein